MPDLYTTPDEAAALYRALSGITSRDGDHACRLYDALYGVVMARDAEGAGNAAEDLVDAAIALRDALYLDLASEAQLADLAHQRSVSAYMGRAGA